MVVNKGGAFLDDAQSLQAIIDALPPKVQSLYRGYGALTLEAGFPNRVLVVYTLQGRAPVNIEVLTLGDMEMTRIGGPTITVASGRVPVTLTVEPFKWFERDLFLHVPQNFVLKWKGKQTPTKGVQFVPIYAVLIKSLSREHQQIDGHTYCVTLNNFRERFPNVPVRY